MAYGKKPKIHLVDSNDWARCGADLRRTRATADQFTSEASKATCGNCTRWFKARRAKINRELRTHREKAMAKAKKGGAR
jgi:hypothetical protein